ALRQTPFEHAPLCGRDDARQQIVGKDALRALRVAVDREGDSLGEKRLLRFGLMVAEFGHGSRQEILIERLTMRARRSGAVEHLVVRGVEEIVGEHRAGRVRRGGGDRSHEKPLNEQKAIRLKSAASFGGSTNFPNESKGLRLCRQSVSGRARSTISSVCEKEPTRLSGSG